MLYISLFQGIGASKLRDCDLLTRMLKLQKQEQRYYAAIGDAPAVVLVAHDLLAGRATCHPTKVRLMGEQYVKQSVVVADHCVTSPGAGTATEFALKLASLVCSQDEAVDAAKQLLAQAP
jgi:protein deglycase